MTIEFIKENLTSKGRLKSNYKKTFEGAEPKEIYMVLHNIENPNCICGVSSSFRNFQFGFNEYCSKDCSNKSKWTDKSKANGVIKRKEYFEANPEELIIKHKKISETNKKVWASGTDLRKDQTAKLVEALNTGAPQIKQKITKEERYGNANYNNLDKMKETCFNNYGVHNPRLILGMTERIEKTFIEKYGYKNNFSDYKIRLKGQETKNKNYLENTNLVDKDLYYFQVLRITNAQNLKGLDNFSKRGRAGTKGAYHLDHRYSIIEGFRNNIPPYIIGNISNLEMIPAEVNISKQGKCSISIEEILKG